MVFKYQTNEKSLQITDIGSNKVILCTFYDLHKDNDYGGAIYVNQANSQFFCSESQFHLCSAKTSGGIHFGGSCTNIDLSKICACLCSSKNSYSFFAYFKASYIACNMYSTNYCDGYVSTTSFSGEQQTISNVDSTHNSGYQEPSFLVRDFTFAVVKFVEFSSNTATGIGFNMYSGEYGFVSHIHYQNNNQNQNHDNQKFDDMKNRNHLQRNCQ